MECNLTTRNGLRNKINFLKETDNGKQKDKRFVFRIRKGAKGPS